MYELRVFCSHTHTVFFVDGAISGAAHAQRTLKDGQQELDHFRGSVVRGFLQDFLAVFSQRLLGGKAVLQQGHQLADVFACHYNNRIPLN